MARPIINADGSAGTVRAYTNLDLELQDTTGRTHRETIKFYIANIGKQDVILGTDCLIKHNPEINWATYQVNLSRCPTTCMVKGGITIASTLETTQEYQGTKQTKKPGKKLRKTQELWTEEAAENNDPTHTGKTWASTQ